MSAKLNLALLSTASMLLIACRSEAPAPPGAKTAAEQPAATAKAAPVAQPPQAEPEHAPAAGQEKAADGVDAGKPAGGAGEPQIEPPPAAKAGKVYGVACGCSVESVGHCLNMIELDNGEFIELKADGLGEKAFCGKTGLKAEVEGKFEEGVFHASSFKLVGSEDKAGAAPPKAAGKKPDPAVQQ